jgi:D-alanine-D-alanine ligase
MTNQLHVAVLFGGRSGEHEVSLMSARSVLSVLDPARYDVTQIGITPDGKWLTGKDTLGKFETRKTDDLLPVVVFPDPSEKGLYVLEGFSGLKRLANIDVFFPILHGTFG